MDLKVGYVSIKILLTIISIFFSTNVTAQGDGFFKLSTPVKLWILTHPFSACKAKKIAETARMKADELKKDIRLDGLENGGQIDAFRHSYWMALMAQRFNCRRAFRLGKAYEKGNERDFKKGNQEEGELPDSVSIAMDLYNNCVGVHIGFENPDASEKELAEVVIKKILDGELLIVKRHRSGSFLSCDDQVIGNNEWQGKWNNQRCLVKSNFKHSEN